MVTMRTIILALIFVASFSFAKDRDYQIASYLGDGAAMDGTYTNNVQCHDNIGAGFTCAGDSGFNQVTLYKIKAKMASGFLRPIAKRQTLWRGSGLVNPCISRTRNPICLML
jgi:hypothetical protein